jgi:hypothetical protein
MKESWLFRHPLCHIIIVQHFYFVGQQLNISCTKKVQKQNLDTPAIEL